MRPAAAAAEASSREQGALPALWLHRRHAANRSLDRPLALTIAAAIVFIVAHTTPLMGLSAVGRHASTTIAGGALEMWLQGEQITAVIVAFCAGIAPGGYILFMLTVLLAVRRPPAPQWVGEMLRWGTSMRPWSMNEVMILGILVALIKIAELATVSPASGCTRWARWWCCSPRS